MESLEEEYELEILRDLLQLGADRRDGDKLCDVEDEGEKEHWYQVTDDCHS